MLAQDGVSWGPACATQETRACPQQLDETSDADSSPDSRFGEKPRELDPERERSAVL